jgi:hypothetical protein
MRQLENIEDQMRGVATYEFEDGRRIQLDARAVQEHGAAAILRGMGYGNLVPTGRVTVMQDGLRVGTVPADFDPAAIKSRSVMYDLRPGDFRREGRVWVASSSLGPGDLQAVPGLKLD